jgi:hypothetical protein
VLRLPPKLKIKINNGVTSDDGDVKVRISCILTAVGCIMNFAPRSNRSSSGRKSLRNDNGVAVPFLIVSANPGATNTCRLWISTGWRNSS